jgi:hypothetical protein
MLTLHRYDELADFKAMPQFQTSSDVFFYLLKTSVQLLELHLESSTKYRDDREYAAT